MTSDQQSRQLPLAENVLPEDSLVLYMGGMGSILTKRILWDGHVRVMFNVSVETSGVEVPAWPIEMGCHESLETMVSGQHAISTHRLKSVSLRTPVSQILLFSTHNHQLPIGHSLSSSVTANNRI